MSDTVFGRFVSGSDVEAAALDTLKLWTPTYLAWAERQTSRAARSLPVPGSWVTATDAHRWPEQALPSVLLLSTGLAEPPTRSGAGSYSAVYTLGVAVILPSEELAKLYTAAFRAILLQHPALGGLAAGVEWIDEDYDVLTQPRRRLAAGKTVYRVRVDDVATTGTGPTTPPVDPYTPPNDGPLVETIEVEVEGRDS